ncbi:hypothetical protein CNMCM5878_008783 [Aspergillus fumigatiaffinis]|nr:hypothetical protein CNMCM5878_008783 [Aspergillus fumigatiaffinis]
MVLSEDAHAMIEDYAQKLLDNNMRLVSIFTTDSHHTHDGSDFLSSEMGIFNQTVFDMFVSPTDVSGESAIEARSPVNGQCQGHGNIQDNLSDFQIKMACGAISQAAAGGVSTVIEVIESKICTEAGTGHPVPSCKTIIGFMKVSGAGFTGLEINNYCPDFLSFFGKCKGSDAKAYAEDKNVEMTAFNSQKDYNCDHTKEKCIEKAAEAIPEGWTNDPRFFEGFFFYDSAEAHLARCHGMNDPKLLLMTTPDTGDMGYIITSGGRFYWGDLMIDHIAEITKPRTWPEILRTLATQGERGLRMKALRPVVVDEEEMVVEGQGPSVPSGSDVPSTSEK